jgi:transcriptional enhancer factor
LFPNTKDGAQNGFDDSFKNDPCLRALASGRLPSRRQDLFGRLPNMGRNASQPVRPSFFKMWMTRLRPGVEFSDIPRDAPQPQGDGDYWTVEHTYTDSVPNQLPRDNLENVLDWRTKFPALANLHDSNNLKCDIVHMEVSLELRRGKAPDKTELWIRNELLIPGDHNPRSSWRCIQSLYKPKKLYGPSESEPRTEDQILMLDTHTYEPGVGTLVQVKCPALSWAHTIQSLSSMEEEFDPNVHTHSARQYIEQITMYQEFQCTSSQNQAYERKTIVLWTFRKCKVDEKPESSWRFLDPAPERRKILAPFAAPPHVASAVMAENFNTWADAPPLLHSTAGFDPIMHGLATPPSTVMPSPYVAYGYSNNHSHPQHDLSPENLSFISHETQDSDSTLVDQNTNNHMDSFLSSALGDFDHSQNLWAAPPPEGFDNDPSFLANYNAATNGSQIWDGSDTKQHHIWVENEANFAGYDPSLGQRMK